MHDELPAGLMVLSLQDQRLLQILHVADIKSARWAVFRIREVLRDPPHCEHPRRWREYDERDSGLLVERSQKLPLGRSVLIRIGDTGPFAAG